MIFVEVASWPATLSPSWIGARAVGGDDRHLRDGAERLGGGAHDLGQLVDDALLEQCLGALGEGLGLRPGRVGLGGSLDADGRCLGLTFGGECFGGGDAAGPLGDALRLDGLGGAAAAVALGETFGLDGFRGGLAGVPLGVRVGDGGKGGRVGALFDGVGLGVGDGAHFGIELLLAQAHALLSGDLLLAHDLLLRDRLGERRSRARWLSAIFCAAEMRASSEACCA